MRKKQTKPSCLLCSEVESLRRGLCVQHYEQFRRKRKLLTEAASVLWEQELIKTGKLLPNRRGKQAASVDAFEDSFLEFTLKVPNAISTDSSVDTAEDVETWTNEAKSESLKRQKKPNGNQKSG